MNSLKRSRFIIVLGLGLLIAGCANTGRYATQKGAAVGAGIGALAGQAIGGNTQSTLIGTGAGALLGTIVGNGMDQQAQGARDDRAAYERSRQTYANPVMSAPDGPPGRWVTVPGRWQGNQWVPAHRQWIPVTPR